MKCLQRPHCSPALGHLFKMQVRFCLLFAQSPQWLLLSLKVKAAKVCKKLQSLCDMPVPTAPPTLLSPPLPPQPHWPLQFSEPQKEASSSSKGVFAIPPAWDSPLQRDAGLLSPLLRALLRGPISGTLSLTALLNITPPLHPFSGAYFLPLFCGCFLHCATILPPVVFLFIFSPLALLNVNPQRASTLSFVESLMPGHSINGSI